MQYRRAGSAFWSIETAGERRAGRSKEKPIQVIAVTGGKGGVGKTNLSVNLSLALAELEKQVVLMDADLGLANVDLLLGIRATKTISDVLTGDCNLRDILIEANGGIKVIPASSGTQEMAALGPQEHAGLFVSDNQARIIAEELLDWRRKTVFQAQQVQRGRRLVFNAWLCSWAGRHASAKHQVN